MFIGMIEEDYLIIEVNNIYVFVDKVSSVFGMIISKEEFISIYKCFGFIVGEVNEFFVVIVLLCCGDIIIEEDLIEEVVRLYGYDNILFMFFEIVGIIGGLMLY